VEVSKLDVADLDETKLIIALAEKMAPVGGIFHLAMILQDRWMSNQASNSNFLLSLTASCRRLVLPASVFMCSDVLDL
jgi:hypothetical protein